MRFLSEANAGENLHGKAVMNLTPDFATAFLTFAKSSRLGTIGFSQRMCTPAEAHFSICSACFMFSLEMATASLTASNSSSRLKNLNPRFSANSLPLAESSSQTPEISVLGLTENW